MSGDGPPRPDLGGSDPGGDDLPMELGGVTLHIPDDARELEADRLALLAELRDRAGAVAAAHAARAGRWAGLRLSMSHFGVTGALLLTVLLMVGVAGTLVSVFAPRAPSALERLPLATVPAVSGSVGGLLPEVDVSVGGRTGDVRAIRPAVLVLVPLDCQSCAEVLANIYTQARQYTLTTVLVGAPGQSDQLRLLDQTAAAGGAVQLVDDDAALASAYSLADSGLTMVLVHADGVVGAVLAPDATTRYESAFVQLPRAGAAR